MKWHGALLAAALGLVAEFIAQADELVIRFEPPSLPHGSKLIAGYSEGGFIFSTPNGMAHTDVGVSTGGYPSNGTAYLTFGANHRPLTISSSPGQTFNLLSVDLAEYSTVFATPRDIPFTGYKTDGSTVAAVMHLDGVIDASGPAEDFQTFTFGSEFSDLVRVEVNTNGYALDNVRVSGDSLTNIPPVITNQPPVVTNWPPPTVTNTTPAGTTVSILTIDSQAREPGPLGNADEALFLIRRSGSASNELVVFFTLSGSAGNGIDYQFISNQVVIAAGATQAFLNVLPLEDSLVEGTETVVLTLQIPVCATVYPPPPGCYGIGSPSQATAYITDAASATNRAPIISITSPVNGSTFGASANILIIANANDPDGYDTVSNVEFFANGNSLGIRDNFPTANPIGPFFLIWSNVAAGNYLLTARATDNIGAATLSAAVNIQVDGSISNEVVIRFEPPSLPRGSKYISNYVENGFYFSTPKGFAHTDNSSLTMANYPANGSAFLSFLAGCTPLTVSNLSGQSFNLLSMDLAEYSTVFARPKNLTVKGYKPDGSTVSNVVTLDGIIDGTGSAADFQTFTFDGTFSGLSRLEITPEIYSLDNLRLDFATTNSPPPSAEPHLIVPAQTFPEIATNGCKLVVQSGGPVTYVVECSLDLIQWTPIHTNTLAGGALEFRDREASGGARRFYRIRTQ